MSAFIQTDHSGMTEGNFTIQVNNEIIGMKDNPDFPRPTHLIADVETKFNEYKLLSKEKHLMSPQDYKDRRELRKVLNKMLRENGIYIIGLYPDDQKKQLSSRYLPVKERNDSGTPPVPSDIHASTGDNIGEVKLYWKASSMSKGYSVRYRIKDSGDAWQYHPARASRNVIIGGLDSGLLYEFWVQALGAKRYSDFGGPAEARPK